MSSGGNSGGFGRCRSGVRFPESLTKWSVTLGVGLDGGSEDDRSGDFEGLSIDVVEGENLGGGGDEDGEEDMSVLLMTELCRFSQCTCTQACR